MSAWRIFAMLCAATLPHLVAAADAPPDAPAKEKARIRAERASVERRYQAALTACGDRFAVTACTDAARADRRAAIERLSREQGVLDDAERKDRAAQRLRRIEDKMREVDQRRETEAPAGAPARPASATRPAPSRHITRATAPAHRASDAGDREAAARAAAAQRRASEAQAHREAVERRNAERAAKKAPAAGLPAAPVVPQSPASPASPP